MWYNRSGFSDDKQRSRRTPGQVHLPTTGTITTAILDTDPSFYSEKQCPEYDSDILEYSPSFYLYPSPIPTLDRPVVWHRNTEKAIERIKTPTTGENYLSTHCKYDFGNKYHRWAAASLLIRINHGPRPSNLHRRPVFRRLEASATWTSLYFFTSLRACRLAHQVVFSLATLPIFLALP